MTNTLLKLSVGMISSCEC